MVMECWAILAILAMILYLYLSQGRPNVAGSMAPLLLLPLFHLLGGPLSRLLTAQWFGAIDSRLLHIAVDLLGAAISCCLFGAIGRSVRSSRLRNFYLVVCVGFTVALAWVLIYNTVFPPVLA